MRKQCETVDLGPTECASTPKKEIQRLNAERVAAERAALCARDDEVGARQVAEEAVRLSLKSPSSADFHGAPRYRQNGCRWIVSGELDAQNSFGATLRSTYRVELLRTGKSDWVPLSVRVSG